jgi:hypothetical protein
MGTLWKVDTTRWEVREVQSTEAQEFDSEDDRIYSNTHYKDPVKAWDGLLRNAKAGLHLSADALERARSSLREAERRAADHAVIYAKVSRAHEKRSQPT